MKALLSFNLQYFLNRMNGAGNLRFRSNSGFFRFEEGGWVGEGTPQKRLEEGRFRDRFRAKFWGEGFREVLTNCPMIFVANILTCCWGYLSLCFVVAFE